MKKILAFLIMACMLFSAVGCSVQGDPDSLFKPTETLFSINSYHLQITADSTFQEKTSGSYDLQITNGSAYISIMAYKYIDLPEGLIPLDIYDMQNEDLFSKRNAVTIIEEAKTLSLSQSTITHALYSAERDGVKNYYASYLVDLPDGETFAWVLVSAMPSYLNDNREYLHDIVCSLTSVK